MKVVRVAFSTIIMIVLFIALFIFGVPRLFGVKMFNVTSGSMLPAYSVNDIVFAVPTDFDKIKVGDPITFMLDQTTVATHRVVEIDVENQRFTTKGDNNDHIDGAPVSYVNVVGVVRFSLPALGEILTLASQPMVKIIAIVVLVIVILLTIILSINAPPSKKKVKSSDSNQRDAEPPAEVIKAKDISQPAVSSKPGTERKEENQIWTKKTPPPQWGKKITKPSTKHMSILLISLLTVTLTIAVGTTLAYLVKSLDNRFDNNFSIGKANINILEPNVPDKNNVEWGEYSKNVIIQNPVGADNVPGVVRAMIVPTFRSLTSGADMANSAPIAAPTGNTMAMGDLVLHLASDWSTKWFYKDGYFYYRTVLQPGESTSNLLVGVTTKPQSSVVSLRRVYVDIVVLSDIIQSAGGAAASAWGITVSGNTVSP